MVVAAAYHHPVIDRYTDHPWWHLPGPLYIHLILINMNRKKVLETILVLVLTCGAIYWWVGKNPYLLFAAGILGLIGLFIPFLAEKIHWGWMKLAEGLGYITSKLVLIVVFIFVLVPVATVSKLFRKKTMATKHQGQSYFTERNFTYNKESLENPW
jgi:hypothetical protein